MTFATPRYGGTTCKPPPKPPLMQVMEAEHTLHLAKTRAGIGRNTEAVKLAKTASDKAKRVGVGVV